MERLPPGGRVVGAGGVAKERFETDGRVAEAGCVTEKRIEANRRIIGSASETEERILALRGVGVGVAPVRWWIDRSGRGRKRKAGEHQRNEKERAQRRAVH